MGSVTIIFIIPIMIGMMLFGSMVGAIKGDNVTKVELPYDPSEGIVWEYDGVDDPLFNLIATETDGDKQIFTFKGTAVFEGIFEENHETVDPDTVMDVIFTNENGEELLYYAAVNHDYFALNHKIEFWSPDEYVIFDYTPKEETTVEGAEWVASKYDKIGETEIDGEKTFTYLFLPNKELGSMYEVYFTYCTLKNDESDKYVPYEKIELKIKANTNGYEVKDEDRFYYDGTRWLSYNPALREEEK